MRDKYLDKAMGKVKTEAQKQVSYRATIKRLERLQEEHRKDCLEAQREHAAFYAARDAIIAERRAYREERDRDFGAFMLAYAEQDIHDRYAELERQNERQNARDNHLFEKSVKASREETYVKGQKVKLEKLKTEMSMMLNHGLTRDESIALWTRINAIKSEEFFGGDGIASIFGGNSMSKITIDDREMLLKLLRQMSSEHGDGEVARHKAVAMLARLNLKWEDVI